MPIEVTVIQIIILFAAGVGAGIINTMAGAGSLITIPVLLFIGLPATVSNATNRLHIVCLNAIGVIRFRQRHVSYPGKKPWLSFLSAAAGAVAGSFLAVFVSEQVFRVCLSIVMVAVMGALFIKSDNTQRRTVSLPAWAHVLIYLCIGVYAGFIQAGVGFLLITAISIMHRCNMIQVNLLKMTTIFIMSIVSLAVFIVNGLIAWLPGIILASGGMVGAWVGVRIALWRGGAVIRWVILLAVAFSVLTLFGII